MKKRKLIKIISIVLACVVGLSGIGVGAYFLFRKKSNKLLYDYKKGTIALEKVEKAQYSPDLEKYELANQKVQSVAYTYDDFDSVEDEQDIFATLVNSYGTVENYAGAGKYNGYDIYEIKNEIAFVVENVPAFNQWFRLPNMRAIEGFAQRQYFESWAYYLEMDEESGALSITRVCLATRSAYIDFDQHRVVEDHENGSSFIQFEVMKTNYFTTKDGNEVVECFLYSVGVDKVSDNSKCNQNVDDYYTFEYQYLRNEKDKNLIKYHITPALRFSDNEILGIDFNDHNSAMDIRGLYPYGARREFMIIDYDGYTNISITNIDMLNDDARKTFGNIVNKYEIDNSNIGILYNAVGIEGDLTSFDIEAVCKHIVDNFQLKQNWAQIYRDSTAAIQLDIIKGPFYGQSIPIKDITSRIKVFKSRDGYVLDGDISPHISDPTIMEVGEQYSVSLAFRSQSQLCVIGTDYQTYTQDQEGGWFTADYRMDISNLNIMDDGEYILTCVLTKKKGAEDLIVFDTQATLLYMGYIKVNLSDIVDSKGVVHHRVLKGCGGKLVLTITAQD